MMVDEDIELGKREKVLIDARYMDAIHILKVLFCVMGLIFFNPIQCIGKFFNVIELCLFVMQIGI